MVYFLVPAYNESQNLPLLVRKTKEAMGMIGMPFRILIVNDGSTDGTSELCTKLAQDAPVTEVRIPENKGVGNAFQTGFSEAFKLAEDRDIIVTKEADNTSDPDILKHMIEHIRAGYDVSLASCFAKGGGVANSTIDRHLLSFGANMLLKLSFPIAGVNTYSSFYRAYNAGRLKAAFEAYDGVLFEERGFVCMVEMLVKLSRLPFKMVEVPMVLKCDKREGASKLRRRRTIAGYLRFIKKQMLRSRALDAAVRERFVRLAGAHA